MNEVIKGLETKHSKECLKELGMFSLEEEETEK